MGNSDSIPVVASSASEGVEKLQIGEIRDDERFGKYVYRHEVVHGILTLQAKPKKKLI